MPISGPLLATILAGEFAAVGYSGTAIPQLSLAIGNGVATSVLATAIYTGISTGLGLGVGSSIGTLSGSIIVGPVVGNFIFLEMTAAGMTGTQTLQFSNAIGNAVATHMATAIVQGASTIVALGTGTGTIIGVVGPLMGAAILVEMAAAGLSGQSTPQLSNAIGNGISTAFASAIATTVITGVPIGPIPPFFPPIPCVGTDTGKLF